MLVGLVVPMPTLPSFLTANKLAPPDPSAFNAKAVLSAVAPLICNFDEILAPGIPIPTLFGEATSPEVAPNKIDFPVISHNLQSPPAKLTFQVIPESVLLQICEIRLASGDSTCNLAPGLVVPIPTPPEERAVMIGVALQLPLAIRL